MAMLLCGQGAKHLVDLEHVPSQLYQPGQFQKIFQRRSFTCPACAGASSKSKSVFGEAFEDVRTGRKHCAGSPGTASRRSMAGHVRFLVPKGMRAACFSSGGHSVDGAGSYDLCRFAPGRNQRVSDVGQQTLGLHVRYRCFTDFHRIHELLATGILLTKRAYGT